LAVLRAVLCVLLTLSLSACSSGPLGDEVVEQARGDGQIAFAVVKVDDAVLTTLLDRKPPGFQERFKKYQPAPELTIGLGDTVSVVVWESAADGLFGNSLTELSFPAGAAARLQLGAGAGQTPTPTPGGVAPSPDLLARLYGAAGADRPGASDDARRPRLERFIGLAQQTGRPGTRIPDQVVGPDGAITIPYAGRIAVAGRTPAEVARRIEGLLGPKALDPQALVVVQRGTANSVSVAGDIVRGARIPLSGAGERLLDVIAAAGGAKAPPHETFVRLSRGGVTATVPLATLVADPEQNIFAEPGDVLTLERQPQTFSVFGAAGKNAAITFASERLSLTEALAQSGGLRDDRADPSAVFLFRYEPVDIVQALGQPLADRAPAGVSPIVYRLDLREAKSYLLAKRFPVQDKDIIFVANAETVPVTEALQALSRVTGPITSALLICQTTKEC
jgi:polysaccharide export outer membrane protein